MILGYWHFRDLCGWISWCGFSSVHRKWFGFLWALQRQNSVAGRARRGAARAEPGGAGRPAGGAARSPAGSCEGAGRRARAASAPGAAPAFPPRPLLCSGPALRSCSQWRRPNPRPRGSIQLFPLNRAVSPRCWAAPGTCAGPCPFLCAGGNDGWMNLSDFPPSPFHYFIMSIKILQRKEDTHPPNYFLPRRWSHGQGSKKRGINVKKNEDKDTGGKIYEERPLLSFQKLKELE